MMLMFGLTLYGWLLFRATSLEQIGYMTVNLVNVDGLGDMGTIFRIAVFTAPLIVMQIFQYWIKDLLIFLKLPQWSQVILYVGMILWIILEGNHSTIQFIYFQF